VALGALQRYYTMLLADAPLSQQGDEAFVASVSASCPNVLAAINLLPSASISRASVVAFGEELGADLVLARFVPAKRAALAVLTRTITALRWSTRGSATTIIRSLVAERRYFALPPSDLCADARALAAANAQSTSPGTLKFLSTFGRIAPEEGLTGVIRTLRRFVTAADDRVVTAVNRASEGLVAARTALVHAEAPKLIAALGLTT
jgi:hypothetical protein